MASKVAFKDMGRQPHGTTTRWQVVNEHGATHGHLSWDYRRRRYEFWPERVGYAFTPAELRDIAWFAEHETTRHLEQVRAESQARRAENVSA